MHIAVVFALVDGLNIRSSFAINNHVIKLRYTLSCCKCGIMHETMKIYHFAFKLQVKTST